MLMPVESLVGDDEEDTKLLREMAVTARNYISSFSWCPTISAMYLAYGVGGVVAIFLVEFVEKIAGTDDRLWVVVGDLPSAYIVVEPQDSSREALDRYCQVLDNWINEVLTFGDFQNVFPVKAPRTPASAELLRRRLDFVRTQLIYKMPTTVIDR